MNKLIIAALVLTSFSFTAQAKEKPAKERKPASVVTIEGKEAKKIYKLLEEAADGRDPECGMGKCWQEGQIQCSVENESGGKYYCQVVGPQKN